MKICVVIPTYNEARSVGALVTEIKQQGLDVLVVDDGSKDRTVHFAQKHGAVVLVNEKNQGKGATLSRGFDYALKNDYDAVITMDGDGQHLPSDIPFFLRLAKYSDSGILVGNRMHKTRNMPFLRLMTNRFMSLLLSAIAGQRVPDTQCGFRLIKKEVLQQIRISTSNFEVESEMLVKASRLGFKIEPVPVNTVYAGEKSRINPFIDTLRFFRFIIREAWISRH